MPANDPNPTEWPLFISHKIVRATPITHINEGKEGDLPALLIEPEGHHRQFFPSEPGMASRATVGSLAVIYDDGYQSVSPQDAFETGYKPYDPAAIKQVLMSRENPDGWKLEDLLSAICTELLAKTVRLWNDPSPAAIAAKAHNGQIVGLLTQAQALQRHTLDLLDAVGPDQGPRGTPRVGA